MNMRSGRINTTRKRLHTIAHSGVLYCQREELDEDVRLFLCGINNPERRRPEHGEADGEAAALLRRIPDRLKRHAGRASGGLFSENGVQNRSR